MLFNQSIYLTVAEMNLVPHVEKRALSQLEMIHGLRPLSSQDDDSESVGERPRDPISGLFRVDTLIVLVIPEVFEAIQDHDDSSLAVSAAGTITLAVLLRLIGATHLGSYGITHQVKAAGEVDTQLIINNMHKASLDVGELLSQLDEGTVDE